MSDPITQAFYNVMVSDGVLAALITAYDGDPAVFTVDPVPEDAVRPYIQTTGNNSDIADPTMDDASGDGLRNVTRDILCFADEKGAPEQIEAIALRVRELFSSPYGAGVPITGWGIIRMRVSGPTQFDPDADTYGRSVEVDMTLQRI